MRYEKHLLKNNLQILAKLNHNLPFADDDYINRAILNRYANYELLYDTDGDNERVLIDNILRWSDYFIQLAKLQGWSSTFLTLNGDYSYNPIENYNRTESTSDKRQTNSDTTINTNTSTNSQTTENNNSSGYNTNTFTPVSNTTSTGSAEGATSSTDKNATSDNAERSSKISGNIGVTTTAQMIAQERQLIMNLVSDYVDKFADCFNITM